MNKTQNKAVKLLNVLVLISKILILHGLYMLNSPPNHKKFAYFWIFLVQILIGWNFWSIFTATENISWSKKHTYSTKKMKDVNVTFAKHECEYNIHYMYVCAVCYSAQKSYLGIWRHIEPIISHVLVCETTTWLLIFWYFVTLYGFANKIEDINCGYSDP